MQCSDREAELYHPGKPPNKVVGKYAPENPSTAVPVGLAAASRNVAGVPAGRMRPHGSKVGPSVKWRHRLPACHIHWLEHAFLPPCLHLTGQSRVCQSRPYGRQLPTRPSRHLVGPPRHWEGPSRIISSLGSRACAGRCFLWVC